MVSSLESQKYTVGESSAEWERERERVKEQEKNCERAKRNGPVTRW